MTDRPPIYVSRPWLPPLDEVTPLLEEIWQSRMLSNRGPQLVALEAELAAWLGIEHISLVANATIGLILGLHHLGVAGGEVITSPFSFAASGHAIRWAGADAVFADIDPLTLNLRPEAVAAQITPRTRAIMPVHAFGVPCDTEALEQLGAAHGIPVIYDAAHAFGIRDAGGSILRHGAMSVLSFHATKVFNTFEGGAVITGSAETKERLDQLKNFGFDDHGPTGLLGLNGKMSEFNAALGRAQLPHMSKVIAARGAVIARYRDAFADLPGIGLPTGMPGITQNHYALPVFVADPYPLSRDGLQQMLSLHGIFARAYFHPLISDLPQYSGHPSAEPARLPVARRVADQVLCLPVSPNLELSEQQRIIDLIRAGH